MGTHHDARAAKSSTAKARSGREQCPHIALSHVSCSALKCQRRHNSDKPDVVPAPAGTLLRVFRLAADAVTSRLSPQRRDRRACANPTARPSTRQRDLRAMSAGALSSRLSWNGHGGASPLTRHICAPACRSGFDRPYPRRTLAKNSVSIGATDVPP